MRNKKILIVKQNLEKTYSGATRTVYEQIEFFKDKNFEIHTVGEINNKDDLLAAGAIVHKTFHWPWEKKQKRRLSFSRQALKIASEIQADLVIGHGDLQEQDVCILHNCVHLAEERINKKALDTKHQMYQVHTPILKNKRFKKLIANSHIMKNDLIDRFQIPSEQIDVVYPSLNQKQFFKMSNEKRKKIRKNLGIKDDEFLVGLITSGNFKKRGLDRYFKAINLMPEEIANKTHFALVGKDKLNIEMQQLLEKNKYKKRINFLPVSNQVEDYFNALDIFVLPARIEEYGRVVAEALACGAPVITTKWVGASEIINGKGREFIYDGESSEQLAGLMEKMLTDQNLREEISKEAPEWANSVTNEEIFKQFEKIYTPMLQGKI